MEELMSETIQKLPKEDESKASIATSQLKQEQNRSNTIAED
jgi:hypothetical protein